MMFLSKNVLSIKILLDKIHVYSQLKIYMYNKFNPFMFQERESINEKFNEEYSKLGIFHYFYDDLIYSDANILKNIST
jgi:hypothetical protein